MVCFCNTLSRLINMNESFQLLLTHFLFLLSFCLFSFSVDYFSLFSFLFIFFNTFSFSFVIFLCGSFFRYLSVFLLYFFLYVSSSIFLPLCIFSIFLSLSSSVFFFYLFYLSGVKELRLMNKVNHQVLIRPHAINVSV